MVGDLGLHRELELAGMSPAASQTRGRSPERGRRGGERPGGQRGGGARRSARASRRSR
jgi:hypothetical protein